MASFGFAVERTLEWSKIIFGERNGFWATALQAARSEFFRDLLRRSWQGSRAYHFQLGGIAIFP